MTLSPLSRQKAPELTREAILIAAIEEFSAHGLSGARMETIANRANVSKSMLFYHFKDKEGLYIAVFEKVYPDIRASEVLVDLDLTKPHEAVERLIEFTFSYHEDHESFVRLVMNENIHHAQMLKASKLSGAMNGLVFERLSAIIKSGQEQGVFGPHVSPINLHLLISSFSFYRISNGHTIGVVHGIDLRAPATRREHLSMVKQAVAGYLRAQ